MIAAILVMVNVFVFTTLFLMNPTLTKDLIRSFPAYTFYTSTYTLTLLIYSFCNIDDLSWGTKGATDNTGNKEKKLRYYYAKIDFLTEFLASNLLMIGFLIVLESFF